MISVDEYISSLNSERAKKVLLVVKYIRENYSNAVESMDYAPKTKFPTFKIGNVYVCVASMKNHISIHFAKYGATEIIAHADPRIISRVGCVNIKDNIDFPIKEIKKAIDFCFKE